MTSTVTADPEFRDVLEARKLLAGLLPGTPAVEYPVLTERLGVRVHVKHENAQPTGAFKVRGGLTLMAEHARTHPGQPVVAYSTGNHAQSIAYAARAADVRCVVVMPDHPNPDKVRAIRALGAEVRTHGETFDEAREFASSVAESESARLVGAASDPHIISGVATLHLELLAAVPDLDAIFVPVGSGTSAAAACLVTASIAPSCEVIAVQSSSSPAAHDSWRAGELVQRPNRTRVEGLATGAGFELPQRIMRDRLRDFVLVSDDEIRAAQAIMLTDAHVLAEGAGAAALAGLLRVRQRYAGRRVAVICSGSNATAVELRAALAADVPV